MKSLGLKSKGLMKNIIFNFKENDIKSVSNWYDELILFLWGWLGMKIIPYIFCS